MNEKAFLTEINQNNNNKTNKKTTYTQKNPKHSTETTLPKHFYIKHQMI